MNFVFVTGNIRSGTTLLDKLLSNHEDISILSQPFPYIYFQVKRDFLNSIDYGYSYHPLSHYFLEERYTLSDLNHFLDHYEFDFEGLVEVFDQMKEYSGQLTRCEDYEAKLRDIKSFNFSRVFKSLQYIFRKKEGAAIYGSKEVLCEEFVPFFLQQGIKCIIIIRDPRAVIASMNYGKSGDYVGEIRPTLFNIRNWRKSAAFALAMESEPNFTWIKYEDLVLDFTSTIKKTTDLLEIEPFAPDAFQDGIYDQDGNLWEGNSSHDPKRFISAASIDKFKELLPRKVLKYIEATCFPEMRCLGYRLNYIDPLDESVKIIKEFSEPFPITRQEFRADYSNRADNIENETKRINLLQNSSPDEMQSRKFFLFNSVFERLRNQVKPTNKAK